MILFLFVVLVARAPAAVAVVSEGESLRYGELNARAKQLARNLRQQGVGPGQRVALCMGRSAGLIVGLLGNLKAGAAYVPLDPSYPSERLAYMLADSAAVVALSAGPAREVLQGALGEGMPRVAVIDLEADVASWSAHSDEDLDAGEVGVSSTSLAYVIYTSGSTGKPKGIEVSHTPVVNVVDWVNRTFAVGAADSLLFVTSIGFDLSVYDIFGILAAGARIWLASERMINDPQRLAQILSEEGITFWDSAPSALQVLVPYLKNQPTRSASLRLIFNSGDWIPLALPGAKRAAFPQARFISLGGATEATVWSNWFEVQDVQPQWKSIPYGMPIQNARYYILDGSLRPAPVGVSGDLYIAGGCLANGYTDGGLTRERFIASPFVPGERLYKSGDLARYYPDGNMEFLGRNDFQVKIRGYRIELGEIEAQLAGCEGIREAVVLAREDVPGDKRLVAYYTVAAGSQVSAEGLRTQLLRTLARYMVPVAYVQLESLPLPPNGKLDRKGLPAPEGEAYARGAYEAPEGEIERTLARVWSEVLRVEQVGRHDDFFELGGHSLLDMTLVGRVSKAYAIELKVKEVFRNPTVRKMTAVGERARRQALLDSESLQGNVQEGVI